MYGKKSLGSMHARESIRRQAAEIKERERFIGFLFGIAPPENPYSSDITGELYRGTTGKPLKASKKKQRALGYCAHQ